MPNTNYRQKNRKRSGPLRMVDYDRCSTDEQGSAEYSTTDNQKITNIACIRKIGGIHVDSYVDDGKTGTNLNRPQWERLLADAQAGKVDAVVVTFMSRLGRGEIFYIARYLLQQAGVDIITSQEQFAEDLQGQMQKDFTILLDGMQPKQTAIHTRTKMEGMVREGYVCGHVPFGYRKEFVAAALTLKASQDKEPPQIMLPHDDDAPIVRQAFAMAKNRCTRADIRVYLMMVTGRKWTTTQVTEMLKDNSYLGNYEFGDWKNENHHPPIIDRELWDEVQAVLAEPVQRPHRKPKEEAEADPYVYYLRGRVRCPFDHGTPIEKNGVPGCVYTQATAGKSNTHYYVCLLDNKREAKCKCPVGRVNADALHYTVLSLIERAARHHTVMHHLIAESGGWSSAPEELSTLRGQLAKRKQLIGVHKSNLLNALGDGRAAASIMARLDKLEQDEREVAGQLEAVQKNIDAAILQRPTAKQVQVSWSSVLDVWTELTEEEKAEMLSALVQEVVIQAKDRVLLRLTPIAEVHGHLLAINSHMGAGDGLEPPTFGL